MSLSINTRHTKPDSHNNLSISLSLLLRLFQIVFNFLAGGTCEFLTVHVFQGTERLGSVGINSYQTANDAGCVSYDNLQESDQYEDTLLEAVQISYIIAPIFGILAFLLNTIDCTVVRYCCSRLLPFFFYLIAIICTGLTFGLFGTTPCYASPTSAGASVCGMGQGAWMQVIALICYFIAMCLMCGAPQPVPLCRRFCWNGKDGDKKKKEEDEADSHKPADEETPPAQAPAENTPPPAQAAASGSM